MLHSQSKDFKVCYIHGQINTTERVFQVLQSKRYDKLRGNSIKTECSLAYLKVYGLFLYLSLIVSHFSVGLTVEIYYPHMSVDLEKRVCRVQMCSPIKEVPTRIDAEKRRSAFFSRQRRVPMMFQIPYQLIKKLRIFSIH